MSAIAAVISRAPSGELPPEAAALVERMLRAMADQGGERRVREFPGAVLGVARDRWEEAPWLAGPADVARQDGIAVVSDAAVYYRDDLARALREVSRAVDVTTPAAAIASAVRRWGADAAAQIEGDFAYIAWDADRHALVAARDFTGRRDLVWAALPDVIVVASSIAGVTAYPGVDQRLDRQTLAEMAAMLWPSASSTAFAGVTRVPPGHQLEWRVGHDPSMRPHGDLPRFEGGSRVSEADADEELRHVLGAAVLERCAPAGLSTVWMSGGYDSTAVFAAGRHALALATNGDRLEPVSIAHAAGSDGDERPFVDAVAAHWKARVHWAPLPDVAAWYRGLLDRAGTADEPFAHAYGFSVETVARQSALTGSRVGLCGMGGDAIFVTVPSFFLPELARRGQVGQLAREWWSLRDAGLRTLLGVTGKPLLPDWGVRLLESARGRPVVQPLDRPVPGWIGGAGVDAARMQMAARGHARRSAGESDSAFYVRWMLRHPLFARVLVSLGHLAKRQGVEHRSPLYDPRVVRVAASRPRHDRGAGHETKIGLRRAMRGLLPQSVLASRRHRTGMPGDLIEAGLRPALADFAASRTRGWRVVEAGVAAGDQLAGALSRYAARPEPTLGLALLSTLQLESWLDARAGGRVPAGAPSGGLVGSPS